MTRNQRQDAGIGMLQGSAADFVEEGRRARQRRPRRSFSNWEVPQNRADPIEVLSRQGEHRVQDLLPIRYGRMAESAFAFYRGAAAIMAADVGEDVSTKITVQLCGDAHVSNFGIFSAPNRSLVFDCNDFDETLPGPWEWDLMRLVASIAVAGRSLGLSEAKRHAVLTSTVLRYRQAVLDFSRMSSLSVWYAHMDAGNALKQWAAKKGKRKAQLATTITRKASTKDSLRAFSKMAEMADGTARFRSAPPLLVPASELMTSFSPEQINEGLQEAFRRYRRTLATDRRHLLDSYRVTDAARRVVGVGSVGTVAWIALLIGPGSEDPLILQIKEATASVLEPYAKKSTFSSEGRRVVEGQRLMQAQSDVLLGWEQMDGPWGGVRDFYVRQLWDGKYSADIDAMSAADLKEYAGFCAWTLARAHCRSGNRFTLAGYVGSGTVLDSALAVFAERYADQNEQDFKKLASAIAAGNLPSRVV